MKPRSKPLKEATFQQSTSTFKEWWSIYKPLFTKGSELRLIPLPANGQSIPTAGGETDHIAGGILKLLDSSWGMILFFCSLEKSGWSSAEISTIGHSVSEGKTNDLPFLPSFQDWKSSNNSEHVSSNRKKLCTVDFIFMKIARNFNKSKCRLRIKNMNKS